MTADRQQPPRLQPVSLGLASLGVAATLAFTLAWMIAGARARGVWIDEIWSLWMSQRDLPLADAVAQRWTHDVHPIFFHALNWLLEPVVGMDIFHRRLLNLIPLTWFVAVNGLVALRYPAARRFALVLVPLLIASHYSVRYFAEHRSYFSGLCFTGSLMACLYAVSTGIDAFKLSRNLGLGAALFASAVFALVTHYVGTIIVGSVVGVSILDLLLRRRWGWAGLLILAGLVAIGLLAPSLLAEQAYLKATAPTFWVKTGPLSAAGVIASTIGFTAVENLMALAAAGLTLVAGYQALKGAPTAAGEAPAWRYALVVALGLGLAALALFCVNILKPIVVSRYLIPLTPVTVALVASLAAHRLLSQRWWFTAFLLNAALIGAVEARYPIRDVRWEGTTRQVRAQVRACPGTLVYALDPHFFSTYTGPPNQPLIEDWGYQEVAAAHGFKVILLDPAKPQAQTLALAAHCPTLFWGEHINKEVGPRELITAPFTKSLPMGVSLAHASLFTGASGFIYSLSPPAAAKPEGQ